jgi:hypothetical protein
LESVVSLVDKITAEMDARRVGRYLALIDEAKVIRATVLKVSKVKAENGAPGKAKITFQAPNEDDAVNPSGVTVAFWMTWRVARMVCDSVNETREARASAGE